MGGFPALNRVARYTVLCAWGFPVGTEWPDILSSAPGGLGVPGRNRVARYTVLCAWGFQVGTEWPDISLESSASRSVYLRKCIFGVS